MVRICSHAALVRWFRIPTRKPFFLHTCVVISLRSHILLDGDKNVCLISAYLQFRVIHGFSLPASENYSRGVQDFLVPLDDTGVVDHSERKHICGCPNWYTQLIHDMTDQIISHNSYAAAACLPTQSGHVRLVSNRQGGWLKLFAALSGA